MAFHADIRNQSPHSGSNHIQCHFHPYPSKLAVPFYPSEQKFVRILLFIFLKI